MSNWENNPLRPSQLKYAAVDAFVLIQIYDYINSRCKELNANFIYSINTNKCIIFNKKSTLF